MNIGSSCLAPARNSACDHPATPPRLATGAALLVAALALSLVPATVAAFDVAQEDLNTSLIHAAGQGDLRSFNLALGMGANINAIDRNGNNAVLLAVQGQQHAMLRMLLDKGVKPDARGSSGFTPLTFTPPCSSFKRSPTRSLSVMSRALNSNNSS